ncbi:MAG: hypothetical protein K8F27_07440 [Sulfuricellaceae bacterium]|nr:hypothetical protein [Sulfuricellaceae bacterium]
MQRESDWQLIAKFLESWPNALAMVIALVLFFVAAATGFTETVKYTLRDVELPQYSVAVGLLAFFYAITRLVCFAVVWMLKHIAIAFKSVSDLLARWYQALRSTFNTRQLVKRRIAKAVSILSPQERAFLELFCADGIALQRTASELLPHQTYLAHWGLINSRLVIKIEDPKGFPVERFALTTEAIPCLRTLFYGGKKPFSEIELRLDRVASSGSSGSSPFGGVRRARKAHA